MPNLLLNLSIGNLSIWPPALPLLLGAGILHFMIGTVAAIVASRKGRDLAIWLPLGLFAGTPALIAAWRLTSSTTASENSDE